MEVEEVEAKVTELMETEGESRESRDEDLIVMGRRTEGPLADRFEHAIGYLICST